MTKQIKQLKSINEIGDFKIGSSVYDGIAMYTIKTADVKSASITDEGEYLQMVINGKPIRAYKAIPEKSGIVNTVIMVEQYNGDEPYEGEYEVYDSLFSKIPSDMLLTLAMGKGAASTQQSYNYYVYLKETITNIHNTLMDIDQKYKKMHLDEKRKLNQ